MSNNRFSIYRDASGYLNYRIIDKNGAVVKVSADVSHWKKGEQHHVATSWVLNSKTQKDELHLFIDGQEVSNILSYGADVSPLLHQKFRTISTEDIVGLISKPIAGSTDLTTSAGSNLVHSSINFTDLGIITGDQLYIEETGFNTAGYLITNVNGNTLTLSIAMPASGSAFRFSINKTSLSVSSQINLYDNIAISTISSKLKASDMTTTSGSRIVSSSSHNFQILGALPGYLLRINALGFKDYYTVVSVSGNSLTLSDPMPSSISSSSFLLYSNQEAELPGVRALSPSYVIERDGYFGNVLTLLRNVKKDDIVLIRTLGLNHTRVRNHYYKWGSSSNILNTRLPTPIFLDDVKIYHVILPAVSIGSSNSTLSAGVRTSNNLLTDQPSFSDSGRTLSISITGDNVNYSTPTTVEIHGTINGTPSSVETISFSAIGNKPTVGKVSLINYIKVVSKPSNPAKSAAVIKVSELKPITTPETSSNVPVIRYSYQMMISNQLSATASSSVVHDNSIKFSVENIGNYVIVYSPPSAVGQYRITAVSSDLHSITLATPIPSTFTGGNYEILNVLTERSGLQNGRFVFEKASQPGVPYPLRQGYYEFDYHASLSVPIEAGKFKAFVGSDLRGSLQSKTIIDDFSISNTKMTDTRIEDIVISGSDSITKHYNSLKSLKPKQNTLLLFNFEDSVANAAATYLTSSKHYIQSSNSVNKNFGPSVSFTDIPIILDNAGTLDTRKEGTIEFWISPLQDTGNDPNYRFYFDASSIASEKVSSINNATVKVAGRVSSVVNIKLQRGNKDFDYFAGGIIDPDRQTLYLNNKLPGQNTPLTVNYIPTGVFGDRISIYKDPSGYINFNIVASGFTHQIRAPIYWEKGSWHKVRAQYRFNQGIGKDEIRLFIDGRERGNILFGSGLLFGEHLVFGSTFVGTNPAPRSISFQDKVNELFLGSDYSQVYGARALIDNFKISNIFRPIILAFGESIDPGYSDNREVIYPSVSDLYTTYLMDFESIVSKTTDFAVIKNNRTGLSDITINAYDSFGILDSSDKSRTVMETLISALKPANSRVFINYK